LRAEHHQEITICGLCRLYGRKEQERGKTQAKAGHHDGSSTGLAISPLFIDPGFGSLGADGKNDAGRTELGPAKVASSVGWCFRLLIRGLFESTR
jgi:hypothetical protein